MVILLAPGPSRNRAPVMSIWPLVSLMVPSSPDLKTTVSAPAWLLALMTAWRRLPAPASFKLLTVKVDGVQRSSRTSRLGRTDGRQPAPTGAGMDSPYAEFRFRIHDMNLMMDSPSG